MTTTDRILTTLRADLLPMQRERIAQGWLGGSLVGRMSRIKRRAIETLRAQGVGQRRAAELAQEAQDAAYRDALQGDLFTDNKEVRSWATCSTLPQQQ